MADYDKLTEYLKGRDDAVVVMSLAEIDELVGGLPASASDHASWWSNSLGTRPHSRYWIDARRQAKPEFTAGRVRFIRGGDNPRGPNQA